jgi:hypothetical protein
MDANPFKVRRQRASTPPATTADARPARRSSAPFATACAPDEQAVETVSVGPRTFALRANADVV